MPYMSKLTKRLTLGRCAVVLAAGLVAACGEQASTEPDSTVADIEVRILPESAALSAGRTLRLTAQVSDTRGRALQDEPITWTSSDTLIAIVDQTGLVTTLDEGTVVVRGKARGKNGRSTITVTSPTVETVASVTVAPTPTSVAQGTTVQLTATPRTSTDSVLSGKRVVWSSSNPAIAQVDTVGRVTGVAAGSAMIVAAVDSVTGTATVNVQLPPVASVTLSPATATRTVGGTLTYTATLRDVAGNVLSGRSISWSSSNPVVATVSGSGTATAVSVGSATIRATSEGVTGTAAFTTSSPTAATVTSVAVTPGASPLFVGDLVQLSAVPRDAAGNLVSGRTVTWSSTNTAVATVTAGGMVSALAAGSATIRATVDGVTGTATVTASASPVGTPIFSSSWSADTGNTQAAVTDGGTWPILVCGSTYPQVLRVVRAGTVGFSETPNVLRLQQRGPSPCGMLQVNDVVPASTTHWGRFYVRNDENGNSGDHPTGYNNAHWNGGAIQAVPWARESQMAAGTWRMSVGGGASYPYNKWWGPVLQNGQWYRFEWEFRYTGPTRYRIYPRVYDANGALVADADDFRQQDYPGAGTHTLATYYANGSDFALSDAQLARHFGMGHEGTSGDATLGYWYYGKFAMSTTGWLGR